MFGRIYPFSVDGAILLRKYHLFLLFSRSTRVDCHRREIKYFTKKNRILVIGNNANLCLIINFSRCSDKKG